MSTDTCCVCDSSTEGSARTYRGRAFCERHYASATRDRRGLWVALVALIALLVVFVLAVFGLAPVVRERLDGPGLLLLGMVLALVPAAIWLAAFYLQDRVEPEPKVLLLGVFVLGALLARAVGQPLINDLFEVNRWAGGSLGLRLLAGVFVVGTIQEFLKYAAVRYSVYGSREFDERVDGVIYGAAAGLGYATMLNLAFVLDSGGVDLGFGAIRIGIAALAHASFAGVTGYFLGRAKFEARGPFWLPAGLLIAAILNGVITVLLGEVASSGLRATPLNGLVVSAVLAGLTFFAVFALVRQSNRAQATAA